MAVCRQLRPEDGSGFAAARGSRYRAQSLCGTQGLNCPPWGNALVSNRQFAGVIANRCMHIRSRPACELAVHPHCGSIWRQLSEPGCARPLRWTNFVSAIQLRRLVAHMQISGYGLALDRFLVIGMAANEILSGVSGQGILVPDCTTTGRFRQPRAITPRALKIKH